MNLSQRVWINGSITTKSPYISQDLEDRRITRILSHSMAASGMNVYTQIGYVFAQDTKEKIEAWKQEYNAFRPHSSLGNLTPDQVYNHCLKESDFSTFARVS